MKLEEVIEEYFYEGKVLRRTDGISDEELFFFLASNRVCLQTFEIFIQQFAFIITTTTRKNSKILPEV